MLLHFKKYNEVSTYIMNAIYLINALVKERRASPLIIFGSDTGK